MPLYPILEEAVNLVAFEARRRRVAVKLDSSGPSPTVHADRLQIQQTLVNLLRNAIEAVDDPQIDRREVVLRARVAGDCAEISVVDSGLGLPADPGLKIFEPFVTTKPEGLGIGLAICKTIVESHGGRLRATSNPDAGATFSLTLPLEPAAGA